MFFLLLTELQKIALDTLGFVLERIEAEAKHLLSDHRLKIESVREALRLKRECKSVECYRNGVLMKSFLDSVVVQDNSD